MEKVKRRKLASKIDKIPITATGFDRESKEIKKYPEATVDYIENMIKRVIAYANMSWRDFFENRTNAYDNIAPRVALCVIFKRTKPCRLTPLAKFLWFPRHSTIVNTVDSYNRRINCSPDKMTSHSKTHLGLDFWKKLPPLEEFCSEPPPVRFGIGRKIQGRKTESEVARKIRRKKKIPVSDGKVTWKKILNTFYTEMSLEVKERMTQPEIDKAIDAFIDNQNGTLVSKPPKVLLKEFSARHKIIVSVSQIESFISAKKLNYFILRR